MNLEDFQREFSASTFNPPEQFSKDLKAFMKTFTKNQETMRKSLQNVKIEDLVNSLINEPGFYFSSGYFATFFREEFLCREGAGKCSLLINDMSPGYQTMQRMAEIYQKASLLTGDNRKQILAENRSLLIAAFKYRIEKNLSVQPAEIEKQIVDSCRLASYFQNKYKDVDFTGKAMTWVKRVTEGMQKNILPKLSDHSRAIISQNMKTIAIGMMDSKADIYPKLANANYRLSVAITSDDLYLNQINIPRTSSLNCHMSVFLPTDEFDPVQGITLSPFSLLMGFDDSLSHELGHWFSSQIALPEMSEETKAKMVTLRSCISDFYKTKTPSSDPVFEGDSIRTEEDFADYFGTLVMPNTNHFSCDVAPFVNYISTIYNQTNQPANPNSVSRYLPSNADVHSSDIFRELHIRMVQNQAIPAACARMMEGHPEARPKKCEF